jgi:hypothetical protein
MTNLDERLASLSEAGDPLLDGLEEAVWRRVGELRTRRNTNRLRAGAVAAALVVGTVNGGVGALASERGRAHEPIFAAAQTPLTRLGAG